MVGAWLERDIDVDSFNAEAEAVLLAFKVASEKGFFKAVFEGDALNMVRLLMGTLWRLIGEVNPSLMLA